MIPAYNEAARLPAYLEEVAAYFCRRGEPFEVLVVNDGSRDATAEVAREIGRSHPEIDVLSFGDNRGKGRAVRAGMRVARGELRLMTDADGATPIAEVPRLEAALRAGADVAIGSRARRDASVVRKTRFHRRLAGHTFSLIVRGLGVGDILDTQCGFKLFRAAVADDLFADLGTDGFGFDVELLMRARRRGYRVAEVPVNWTDQPGSKVTVLRDSPAMLRDVVLARWRLAVHPPSRRQP